LIEQAWVGFKRFGEAEQTGERVPTGRIAIIITIAARREIGCVRDFTGEGGAPERQFHGHGFVILDYRGNR